MGLTPETRLRLTHEGIQTIVDLREFDEDSLKQVALNLSRPSLRIPDPTAGMPGGAPNGATLPCPPFPFNAKSQARLVVATEVLKFYNTIGRTFTAADMQWDRILRNFGEQWKAIKEAKKETPPDVPVISKALPIIKWIEAFHDHCYRCIGHRFIPLEYVIREHVLVPAVCPDRVQHQAYTEAHGSILDDLINRASHDHGLYPKDNAEVYFKLEEATRATNYADSIKPFQRRKDGHAALRAIVAQFAGTDKWEAAIKVANLLLHTRKWKGSQNFPLEKFVALHRNAYVSLQACADHVEFQLPNEHSRVGYVIDAIESDDAPLQAAMANINDDTGPGGKRGDFEAAVAYLLPKDPVVKRKQQEGKRPAGEISDLTANVSDFGSKVGIGKTGVHLRYHSNAEYKVLKKPQQDELREWRKSNPSANHGPTGKTPGRGKHGKKARVSDTKATAAMIEKGIEKELAKRDKAARKAEKQEESGNLILDFLAEAAAAHARKGSSNANASSATVSVTRESALKSILKKAKYQSKKSDE